MGFMYVFLLLSYLFGALFIRGTDAEERLETVPSYLGFLATTEAFEGRLTEAGFTILAKMDQALPGDENAANEKLLYIFGKPDRVDDNGWYVVEDPRSILIWRSDTGKTMLSYEQGLPDTQLADSEDRVRAQGLSQRHGELKGLVEGIGLDARVATKKMGPPASPSGLSVVDEN